MKILFAHLMGLVLALVSLCQPVSGQIELQQAFPALSFTRPVDLQHPGDGTNRLFVVEQRGVISVFENDPAAASKTTFLDIQERVDDSSNEEGLLGLAFHPDYENNGYFYVNYTATGPDRTLISRFKVSANNPNAAEPDSEVVIITIPKPFSNHNAGQLAFGPNDGYLYITTGDGGSGGDPQGNGQNRQTLLGSILRIDVDTTAPGLQYSIPPTNPFVGNAQGYREEIYAWGVRNPWRMSFDPVTGWLWAADVGQNAWEEIDIIENGKNYGWNIMEGNHCYNPPTGCNTAGLTLPVWEYSHNLGNSVTGGYVYRGPGVPELVGKYIYADFGSGRIWALEYDGVNPAVNNQLIDTPLLIASFGVDQNQELYICAFDGKIYRFKPTPTGSSGSLPVLPERFALGQNFPNPFNPVTKIPYRLDQAGKASITIYDLNGKLVNTLVDSMVSMGQHSVSWDGSDFEGKLLAGGVYFYRLKVDNIVVQTRKMVFLK
ncbi:MAG: PQQ-dependent sugar dehydrogenase [Calditrichaceae bacterium]|nr:PQQ-dependent sugar dehydrogenase [Calditrichia bacterium]NUQ44141.1 PQQ-dependent sugar dehydrogenase [Calditrichaceae bacterium]